MPDDSIASNTGETMPNTTEDTCRSFAPGSAAPIFARFT
eukprot:CAMPEP_0183457564 /NCGR_PEP_ID=MMETSP0370-20130417/131574_1 /TAXON_ID=268820 /ORGANISM="Peridinium aciculiferum, Strain PAER-2" /LENGTH=38 /DNA_ID= /DNA_START= /DNA_END= /DNA_ORIENTATION=